MISSGPSAELPGPGVQREQAKGSGCGRRAPKSPPHSLPARAGTGSSPRAQGLCLTLRLGWAALFWFFALCWAAPVVEMPVLSTRPGSQCWTQACHRVLAAVTPWSSDTLEQDAGQQPRLGTPWPKTPLYSSSVLCQDNALQFSWLCVCHLGTISRGNNLHSLHRGAHGGRFPGRF